MTARGFLTTSAFVLEHNKRRLLILLAVAALILFFYGIRSVFEGLAALVGQMPGLLITLIFYAFAFIAQFGALMWFLSRPRTYTVTPDDPQIGLSFDDYRGQPDLVDHAKTLVRILGGVERFKLAGGEMPKGMLLSGQPGTGKTFLAGVIAAEAKLPFIYIDSSSLRSMWMGVDALIIISLFRKGRGLARKYAKPGTPGACLLFMDEIDSIGMSRGGVQGGQQQGGMGPMGMFGGTGMSLNTLLNQMDSLGQHVEDRFKVKMARWLGLVRGPVPPKPLVFVIGATNRPDTLDTALTRPGRLDRSLIVYPPDGEGRKDIIQHYLSKKAHDETCDVDMMAQDSIGWTPIHIKTIINEALIVAHEDGRDKMTYKDWLAAADMRFLGLKQPIAKMSADDKRAVAYHEAGHAVVAQYLRPEDRMKKASIIRRGETLGVVQSSEREERHQLHARQIETDIMVSLGSRAVEELILGTKLAGASSDLMQATNGALTYVARLGMGSTLMVAPASMTGYPPAVLVLVDKMLQELYEETKRLILEKEYAVHAVANSLIERQELIGSELDEIFRYADEAHPEKAAPFVRKPLILPTMDEIMKNGNGHLPLLAIPETPAQPVPGQPPGPPGPPGPVPVPPGGGQST
ncbi:MAG: AAA family ATPase [Chloroflexi bacterium]|nr:MAG: AAA family ATPase [Chloroflexota bacterium]